MRVVCVMADDAEMGQVPLKQGLAVVARRWWYGAGWGLVPGVCWSLSTRLYKGDNQTHFATITNTFILKVNRGVTPHGWSILLCVLCFEVCVQVIIWEL